MISAPYDSKCEGFYQFLKENWVKHGNGYYGFIGDSLMVKKGISSFNDKQNKCLVGTTRKQIYELLGNPTIEYVSNDNLARIEYFFNANCEKGMSGCVRLKIRIDPRIDTVTRVLPIIREKVFH